MDRASLFEYLAEIISEIMLCLKEVNATARVTAYDLLVHIGQLAVPVSEDGQINQGTIHAVLVHPILIYSMCR